MILPFLPEENRQKYLFGALIFLFIAGGGIAWFGYFREGPGILFSSQPAPPPQEVKIDLTVFDDPVFAELGKPRPPIPPPGDVGKRNPFQE